MEQTTAPAEYVTHIAIKLPLFWTEDPTLWLLHAKFAFRNAQMTQSCTNFDNVVRKLPQNISIRGLIMNSASLSSTPRPS